MNALIFDIAVVAVLLLFVLQGRRRGFVLTLCGLLAMFVALIGACVLSNLLSAPVAQLVEPVIESSVTQLLHQYIDPSKWQLQLPAPDSSILEGAQTLLPQLPLDQALAALEGSWLYSMFGQSLRNALEAGALEMVSGAAASISAYLAREVARLVLFILSFLLVLLAWKLLSHALDLAFRLPVLSSINRLMGGVIGFVKGALVVFIGAWLLKGYLPAEVVEQTYLLKFFCENSPLSLLAMI